MTLPQSSNSPFQRPLIGAVFDLNANRARIAGVAKDGEETPPLDIAHAGQFRRVEVCRVGKNADIVKPILIDSHILRVDVK